MDKTNFYCEAGGQAGDKGRISCAGGGEFEVRDTQLLPTGQVAHLGTVRSGSIDIGEQAMATVDSNHRLK